MRFKGFFTERLRWDNVCCCDHFRVSYLLVGSTVVMTGCVFALFTLITLIKSKERPERFESFGAFLCYYL